MVGTPFRKGISSENMEGSTPTAAVDLSSHSNWSSSWAQLSGISWSKQTSLAQPAPVRFGDVFQQLCQLIQHKTLPHFPSSLAWCNCIVGCIWQAWGFLCGKSLIFWRRPSRSWNVAVAAWSRRELIVKLYIYIYEGLNCIVLRCAVTVWVSWVSAFECDLKKKVCEVSDPWWCI